MTNMKLLVTGVAGQLGHDVINELFKRGIVAIGSDILSEDKIINKASWDRYVQLDITDKEAVDDAIEEIKPNAIIHCAAWTNVDGAELPDNKQLVKNINVDGTDNNAKISDTKKISEEDEDENEIFDNYSFGRFLKFNYFVWLFISIII